MDLEHQGTSANNRVEQDSALRFKFPCVTDDSNLTLARVKSTRVVQSKISYVIESQPGLQAPRLAETVWGQLKTSSVIEARVQKPAQKPDVDGLRIFSQSPCRTKRSMFKPWIYSHLGRRSRLRISSVCGSHHSNPSPRLSRQSESDGPTRRSSGFSAPTSVSKLK